MEHTKITGLDVLNANEVEFVDELANCWNEYDGLKKKEEKASNDRLVMAECIGDALVYIVDYDGFNTVDGLKGLIDYIRNLLKSGYPEGLYNEIKGEICPICHQVLAKAKE